VPEILNYQPACGRAGGVRMNEIFFLALLAIFLALGVREVRSWR